MSDEKYKHFNHLKKDNRNEKVVNHGRAPLGLSTSQLQELYNICIRMASENKINVKNTWSLNLIDYITELVNTSGNKGNQLNFQKASCTLDAGVKIYCSRVDSIYFEAFKLLSGISRSGNDFFISIDENFQKRKKKTLEKYDSVIKKQAHKHNIFKKNNPEWTLTKSEAITMKISHTKHVVNLLLNKLTLSEESGRSCDLFLNYLSIFDGCTLLIDTNDIPIPRIVLFKQHEDFYVDLYNAVSKDGIFPMILNFSLYFFHRDNLI